MAGSRESENVNESHGATTPLDHPSADDIPTDPIAPPPSDLDSPVRARPGPRPQVPDYTMIRDLGRGGFGEVWLAQHQLTGVYRAVKVISKAGISEIEGIREMLTAVPAHPHIVSIEHVGHGPAGVYCVMPLADSAKGTGPLIDPETYRPMTLSGKLRRATTLNWQDTAEVALHVAKGLEHLHNHGVSHCDVKPANVLRIDGKWCLGDHGLAVDADGEESRGHSIGYAPPEGTGTPKADLYALGATMFQMLAGRLPGAQGDDVEVDAPRWLLALIDRLLDPAPSGRPDSAAAVRARIESRLQPAAAKPTTRSTVIRWTIGAVVLASLSLLVPQTLELASFWRVVGLNSAYENWVRDSAPSVTAPAAKLSNVAVLSIDDGVDYGEVAAAAGVEGVSMRRGKSLRRLHGAVAARLAEFEPKAVVFDIEFRGNSPNPADDAALAAGIDALTENGIGVVTVAYGWTQTGPAKQHLADAVQQSDSIWGMNQAVTREGFDHWITPLAVETAPGRVQPGVAMAAYLAATQAGAAYELNLNKSSHEIVISTEGTEIEQRYRASYVEPSKPDAVRGKDSGLRVGMTEAMMEFANATEAAHTEVRLPIEDLFDRSRDLELRNLLSNRVIVIGDAREASRDYHTHSVTGVREWGPSLIASSIETCITRNGVRVESMPIYFGSLATFTLAGVLIAVTALRLKSKLRALLPTFGCVAASVGLRLAVYTVLLLLALIVGRSVYSELRFLWSPISGMLAAILAGEFIMLWSTLAFRGQAAGSPNR
ncbi:MAG: protein kinase [Planctomycetota bacterium]